jgi:hypothetical protein
VSAVDLSEMRDEARWSGEGGHDPAHVARATLVEQVRAAGDAQLGDLWDEAVREYGEDEASRIWQEALASSDASET